jgi:hypothetical protein
MFAALKAVKTIKGASRQHRIRSGRNLWIRRTSIRLSHKGIITLTEGAAPRNPSGGPPSSATLLLHYYGSSRRAMICPVYS